MIVGIIISIGCCAIIIGVILWKLSESVIIKVDDKQIARFEDSLNLTGLPIITFFQGENKYNFIIDTGSNVSYLNNNTTMKYTLTDKTDTFFGSNGIDQDTKIANLEFTYKERIYNCAVRVADLNAAFKSLKDSSGVLVTGILGNDFMQAHKYCIDFKEFIVYARK